MTYIYIYTSCLQFISFFKAQEQIIETGEVIGSSSSYSLMGIIIASLVSVIIFITKWSFKQQDDRKKEFERIFKEEREEIKRLHDSYKNLEEKYYDTLKDHSKQIQKINKDHSEKIEKLISDYKEMTTKFNNSIENLTEVVKEIAHNKNGKVI